jgi:hypothetical protein
LGNGYELTPSHGSWTKTLLHGFGDRLDGANPLGGVQLDPAGNAYGTTNLGGIGQEGTAFQLVPSASGWTLNIIGNFNFNSGGFALLAGLIVGPGGNLYGGTADGNPNPVVYELSPSNGRWIQLAQCLPLPVLLRSGSQPGDGFRRQSLRHNGRL